MRWTFEQRVSPLRGFDFRRAVFRGFAPTAKIFNRYAVKNAKVAYVAGFFDRTPVAAGSSGYILREA